MDSNNLCPETREIIRKLEESAQKKHSVVHTVLIIFLLLISALLLAFNLTFLCMLS